jgi:cytochrome b6-f complex iron-sulfur subunit
MEKMETELTRGQFLKQLGLNGATLMAIYCMGTLSSCSKKVDPAPIVTPPVVIPPTKIDFVLDLTSTDFKSLKTEGEFVIKDTIIIANAKGGKYVALTKECTHQGSAVAYRSANDDFKCPLHGSEFNTDGSVKGGPATAALKIYKTEVQDSGNKLRVFEG